MRKRKVIQLLTRNNRLWVIVAASAITAVAVWQGARWSGSQILAEMARTGGERLNLYSGSLDGALRRHAYLPYILARHLDIVEGLSGAGFPARVNRYLEDLRSESGADVLYVLDSAGVTRASSNWREDMSFIGRNYSFRPYFKASREGRKGQFFGIGATTGQPGYFMSHPVARDGSFVGATVVKVDLNPLQREWREGGENVFVTDVHGVVFLSSRDDWRYRTLAPLSEAQRRVIRAGRQYGDQALHALPLERDEVLGGGVDIIHLDGKGYLALNRSLERLGWTLHHLTPLEPVIAGRRSVGVIGTVSALLVIALGLYVHERRQKQASRRKAREAEAMRELNLRLQAEVVERKSAEKALRDAQEELVQSSKLAALGRMAAGIVHELNQPIAAMRTYAASARLLVDRGSGPEARETLDAAARMTERMASITAQLKTFARKGPVETEAIVLQDSLAGALQVMASPLQEMGVEVVRDIPEQPIALDASRGRLEQVWINLLRNALDAMCGTGSKHLEIRMAEREGWAEVTITDSGKGIDPDHLGELFTPFFTTKEVGEGLGLGLSITYGIVTEMGGTIRAANGDRGGAVFTIMLPVAEGGVARAGNG